MLLLSCTNKNIYNVKYNYLFICLINIIIIVIIINPMVGQQECYHSIPCGS